MVRMRSFAVGLVAAMTVAACSSDPEPIVEADPAPSLTPPSSSTSASGTSSPSPTSTGADETPEETVRRWVGVWNDARLSGDTSQARAFAASPCRGCDDIMGPVDSIYANGGTFTGGQWTVDKIVTEGQTDGLAEVNLAVTVAQGTTVPSQGASQNSYAQSKHILSLGLVPTGDGWRFSMMKLLS